MKLNEAITKLEALISGYKKQAFEQYPLTDGRIVSVEGDIAAGSVISEILVDGTKQPLADGTYTLILPDGANVIIDVLDNIIKGVSSPKPLAPVESILKNIEDLEKKIEDLEKKIEDLEKKTTKMQNATFAAYDVVRELAAMQAAPTESAFDTSIKQKRENDFVALLKQKNKKNNY